MSIKVSVIIPTYNRASMLGECLDSVFSQTYKDFEVIVVDDGSADNTEEMLRPYFDRIKYIRQDNKGNAAARNAGIREAKGEYIAFNDSDDLWVPEKLEKQIKYLEEHRDVDMVCGNGIIFGNINDSGRLVIPNKRAESLRKNGISLRDNFMKSSIRTPTIVIRKSILDKLGGFDENLRVCVDGDFSLRFLAKYKAHFMNEVLFRLRKHDANVSADREKRMRASIMIIEKLVNNSSEMKALIGQNHINRRLSYRYYKLAKTLIKKKQYSDATENIRSAIRLRPFFLWYRIYQLFIPRGN